MVHQIAVNLFGQFEVRLGGVPVRMPTRKVELILALLAIEPDVAFSRSTLAGLLWPGQPDAQARASLRQAIFRLKTALEPSDALQVTSGWIKLRGNRVKRDIDALDHGAAASALPIGTPLEGLSGYEAEIENRLDAARAELRARLMRWLGDAQAEALSARRFADLETLARRHLVLDSYDEGALRMLMTALWRQGRRNAALEVFRETSQRIRLDLSVSVAPATAALHQEIRTHPDLREDQEETAAKVEASAETAEPSTEPPLPHLRHIAVAHIVSDRLLAALRNRDPEDAEAASRAASEAIERVVRREGGMIAGRAGHRLSCVFGANRPDESPALSAALAAFEIARLDCAVGIDAARALVGGESDSYPAAHLAQFLAETAVPGAVIITEAVADACRGAFLLEKTEVRQAEGSAIEDAWRLTGEVISRGGFDIRKARGLTPLVGRETEVEAILSVAALSGPRAVAITGEAGIGKSRLVHDCLLRLDPPQLLRVQFLPNETGGGIGRFTPMLATLLQNGDVDDPMGALRDAMPDEALRTRVAPAAVLLAKPGPVSTDADLKTPIDVRIQALADAFLVAIQVLASRDAVLLVEDAHWADDDGALLLERVLRSLDRDGPLVIVTFRPGRALNLTGWSDLRTINLAPLTETEAARLLALLDRDGSGDIAARSGGVPLFLEELARADEMPGPAGLQQIPETLTGLLSRRIDALPPHLRRTIEAAAVLGSEPADDLLLPLSGLGTDAYEAAISQLADGDLLFRIRSVPQRVYGFKHALVQEAAYQAIPTRRRKALHARIVAEVEPAWRAGDMSVCAMLASHAERAGQPRQAVDFAFAAAKEAISNYAHSHAERLLDLAERCLRELAGGDSANRLKLQVQQLRLPILAAHADAKGLQSALSSALVLARDLGDEDAIVHLSLHAGFAYQHTNPDLALLNIDRVREIGERRGDALLTREAAHCSCQILSFQGRMREAVAAIHDHVDAWSDDWAERDEYLVSRYVMNQYLLCRSNAGLGASHPAARHARQCVLAATTNDHPVDRYIAALALGDLFCHAERAGHGAAAYKIATDISSHRNLALFNIFAEAHCGIAELETANADRGKDRLRSVLGRDEVEPDPVVRLEVETALLVNEVDRDGSYDLDAIKNTLSRVRHIRLPALELRLLEALAKCEPAGPWAAAASAIRAQEMYAACSLSDAEADALIEALS